MIDQLSHEPLFVMRLNVAYDQIQHFGAVSGGERAVFPVLGGTFEGPKLRGRVLPHGADWVLWRSDGVMEIDVRTALETDDGARISMQYAGFACGTTAETNERFRRREVLAYEDIYVRTTPRFETADPRYEWLNRLIAVANGARMPEGPMYHVFAIR